MIFIIIGLYIFINFLLMIQAFNEGASHVKVGLTLFFGIFIWIYEKVKGIGKKGSVKK